MTSLGFPLPLGQVRVSTHDRMCAERVGVPTTSSCVFLGEGRGSGVVGAGANVFANRPNSFRNRRDGCEEANQPVGGYITIDGAHHVSSTPGSVPLPTATAVIAQEDQRRTVSPGKNTLTLQEVFWVPLLAWARLAGESPWSGGAAGRLLAAGVRLRQWEQLGMDWINTQSFCDFNFPVFGHPSHLAVQTVHLLQVSTSQNKVWGTLWLRAL